MFKQKYTSLHAANNVLRKLYTQSKNSRKFLLCITFLGSLKCSNWCKLCRIAEFLLSKNILCIINLEQQKCSTQYNLLRIAGKKCSTPYTTYPEWQKSYTVYNQRYYTFPEQQKCSTRYNLLGIIEMLCPVLAKIFYFVQLKQSTPNSQNQSTQKNSTQKQSTQNSLLRNCLLRNSLLGIVEIVYSV